MTPKETMDKLIAFAEDKPVEILACIGTAIEALAAYRNMPCFRDVVEKALAQNDDGEDVLDENYLELYERLYSFAGWNLAIEKSIKNYKGGIIDNVNATYRKDIQ